MLLATFKSPTVNYFSNLASCFSLAHLPSNYGVSIPFMQIDICSPMTGGKPLILALKTSSSQILVTSKTVAFPKFLSLAGI